jgi:hypothetical protein
VTLFSHRFPVPDALKGFCPRDLAVPKQRMQFGRPIENNEIEEDEEGDRDRGEISARGEFKMKYTPRIEDVPEDAPLVVPAAQDMEVKRLRPAAHIQVKRQDIEVKRQDLRVKRQDIQVKRQDVDTTHQGGHIHRRVVYTLYHQGETYYHSLGDMF